MEPAPCTYLKENVLQPHPKSVCVRFSVFLLGTKFLWASLSFFFFELVQENSSALTKHYGVLLVHTTFFLLFMNNSL